VVRLQIAPPTATLDDARAMWDRAEIRGCLDALRFDPSLEAAILAARCSIRLQRPTDALDRLDAVSHAALGANDGLRGEFAVTTALVHYRLGDEDLADAALCEARAYIYSTRDSGLEAELDILESQIAWNRRELKRARAIAERTSFYAPSGTARARALQMLGVVEGTQGKYKSQIDFYERAWTELGTLNEPWLRAGFLEVLAALCDDLFRKDLVPRLTEREQTLPWTRDTECMHFEVLHRLAHCRALSGDHIGAFRLLRRAAEIAPSCPWRIGIFAERSSLAAEMNEQLFAREELEQARSLASSYDWSDARGEERICLLRLAQVAAATDVAGARSLLTIYRKKLPAIAPNTLAVNDNRLRALEAHTFGIVDFHAAEARRAIEHLTKAFTVWRDIDYTWRAMDAAIYLHRLTGAAVFFEYARRHAATFPGTWLARQAERLDAASGAPKEAASSNS
jgi:tetratricopeptide (TPR) repeat protein